MIIDIIEFISTRYITALFAVFVLCSSFCQLYYSLHPFLAFDQALQHTFTINLSLLSNNNALRIPYNKGNENTL